jgi:hypothetical protein
MSDSSQPFAPKKFLEIKGKRMACIDEGEGAAIVFQHGNPWLVDLLPSADHWPAAREAETIGLVTRVIPGRPTDGSCSDARRGTG